MLHNCNTMLCMVLYVPQLTSIPSIIESLKLSRFITRIRALVSAKLHPYHIRTVFAEFQTL